MQPWETVRDRVPGELPADLVERRRAAGWRLSAVEWERGDAVAVPTVDTPYGLRVANDCSHLEVHPEEREVLRIILRGVVNDRPLSDIAAELNRRGYHTRSGSGWNQASVFQLMPAVVDHSPGIFSEHEWPMVRQT